MGYVYEYATEQDGEEIADLLEKSELGSGVSIAYCRRPNAVLSLARDGDKSVFAVARNGEGRIVGVGGCAINRDIAYMTGLRAIDRVDISKIFRLGREFCAKNGVRLTYTTILEDNVKARKLLEKKRASMPDYLWHSVCVTHIIRKNLKIKDRNELVQAEGVYILQNPAGEELARGQAVEQWDYKQYIIKRYGWRMKLAKCFFPWLPSEGETLKIFTLKGVEAKNDSALESFLRHISNIPQQGGFFLFGGDFCPVRSIQYRSIVYIVDWDKSGGDVSKMQFKIEIADL